MTTKRPKSAKLTKEQRQALAEAMLRRGLLLRRRVVELGAADRVSRAVACMAETELRAAASRLLCQYPGPNEDQFAEMARSAYRDVSARVDLAWTALPRMGRGAGLYLTFGRPEEPGKRGRR